MAVLEFPYLKYQTFFLPVIPVRLGSHLDVYALVDSGATVSLFEAGVGEALGLRLSDGKKRILGGVGGRILAYAHRLPIQVGTERFSCEICFSPEMKVSFNLLGQEDFFEHFDVMFLKRKKTLRLFPQTR